MNLQNKKSRIITMLTDVCDQEQVLNETFHLASLNKGAYICVSNVHMCIETLHSEEFKNIVNSADIIIPDGRPIYWGQRLLGETQAQQVRGQDIMHAICKKSGSSHLNIGLYGGSSAKLVEQVKDIITTLYPDINLKFYYSPPFRPLTKVEDDQIIQKLNQLDIHILFVGIGCPKQERWMFEHKDKLNCVMLGVGAAFDFIAGTKSHAPQWMQKSGLEWLFRLFSEPKRLWKRYLYTNPCFIFHFTMQLLGRKYS